MKTHKELAVLADERRRPFHEKEIPIERIEEHLSGHYNCYAGETEELIRVYCLYMAHRDISNPRMSGPAGATNYE